MIFHFSGTGNSYHIADRLGSALNDGLVSMPRALRAPGGPRFRLGEGETVGFVLPVYFWGIPSIVLDFVSALELEGYNGNYVYLVLTCGAETGAAPRMFGKALRAKGWRLAANFALPMVDNYVLMYDVADEARRGAALAQAEGMVDGIVASIREKAEGDHSACAGAFPRFMTSVMYPLYGLSRTTRKFRAGESCTACGFCARICPSGAIRLEDGRPRWAAGKCVHCLACINRCPSRAIEYGKGTEGRGRYRNPLAPGSW